MSKQTGHTTQLGADVPSVWAALTSQAWAERKADRLGDDSRQVSSDATPDGGLAVALSRKLPDGVPGWLKRFLPPDGRVVQTDTWDPAPADPSAGRQGRWVLTAQGVPAQIGGPLRLEPTAGGCRYSIQGEVKVNVPLIGGKAESYLADLLDRLMVHEGELLAEFVG